MVSPTIYTEGTTKRPKAVIVKKLPQTPQLLILIGIGLIAVSVLLFVFILAPVAKVEINYNLNKPTKTVNQIKPISTDFGIIIPKIGANARIIKDVDPFNPKTYEVALSKGVAQAKGTAFPNQTGNMFLFSHSSANLLEATRFNSVFYLLSKLKKGDDIYIYFENQRYKYSVSEIKIVDASDVSYLNPKSDVKTLTLMTCWPAGTSYKRLLVIAK